MLVRLPRLEIVLKILTVLAQNDAVVADSVPIWRTVYKLLLVAPSVESSPPARVNFPDVGPNLL